MHQVLLVGKLQGDRSLANDFTSVGYSHRPEDAKRLRGIESIDILHHQVIQTLIFTSVSSTYNIGVAEFPDRSPLFREAVDGISFWPSGRVQNFNSHRLIELRMPCTIDGSPRPPTNARGQLVFAKLSWQRSDWRIGQVTSQTRRMG